MSDDFFALVGNDPVKSLETCPKDGCGRRIVPDDELEDYPEEIMTCPHCFEYFIASPEEQLMWQRVLSESYERNRRRWDLKTIYGPNSKSYDSLPGYKRYSFDHYPGERKRHG